MATIRVDATSPGDKNVENLTDIDEIQKAYDELCRQENVIAEELSSVFEHQAMLENKMVGLHKTLPNLQILQNDSKQLSSMISFTSTLAENVSSKVRKLDLAKSQVSQCITRVEDILDLKFCTDGVQTALQNEDYEKAAGHVHRFRNLDESVIRMSADSSEGGTLETSFRMLYESEEKLKTIVNSKFSAAVHSGDVASVERFFKIFPLLGMHDEGLTKFGKYLSSQLSETADRNLKIALDSSGDVKRSSVLYADTIIMLLEGIARTVEVHQPLVETYYGPGKLIVLLKILQKECDRQVRKVIEKFKQSREYDKKVRLVQTSLISQKQNSLENRLDPMEVDLLLSEIVLINNRSELYLRFMKRKAMGDLETSEQESKLMEEGKVEVEKLINESDLSRLMQELIGNYIMMEEYFMKEMVVKAVNMDVTDEGAKTSSMVDDAFFIVKKSVRRTISSSSVDGVCAMLNHAGSTLEQDFREVLYTRLRGGYPSGFDLQQAYNIMQSSFQQGKLTSSDQEKEKARTLFLTALNNSEVSCDYCKALKTSLDEEVNKLYSYCNEHSKAKLETCLNDLGSVPARFKDVVDFGFSQLTSSAVKPRIKPLVDTFLATGHNLTEEEFSNFEANDPWLQNFIANLDNMLKTFKESLTNGNNKRFVNLISVKFKYVFFKESFTNGNNERFVNLITGEISVQLEKAVVKTAFNRVSNC
ncbi:conserved oligomeric Golgi complex subunit 4 [Patella vulgata]|uniref:conserved oligomeric Golgi complex subunit 4 n=1 Tax=Patella vulgata TaxID=6465 RepID=UPI0024A94851|nr:conserved oligomeric Golgi complex subunit 4 [Patella vulgata]